MKTFADKPFETNITKGFSLIAISTVMFCAFMGAAAVCGVVSLIDYIKQ